MTVASAQVKSASIFAALQADGKSTIIEKLWEGTNSIIDLIESGKINFVINAPTIWCRNYDE